MITIDKVTALITRGEGRDRELLVFRHPTAGVQLPAGTVEPGESYEDAVLREAHEETGLTALSLIKQVGTLELKYTGTIRRVIPEEAQLRSEPHPHSLVVQTVFRGMMAQLGREENDYVFVTHPDSYMWVTVEDQLRPGWLPVADVRPCVESRRLFHLRLTAPAPQNWSLVSDGGLNFHCFWVRLTDDPQLVTPQQIWLETAREHLT